MKNLEEAAQERANRFSEVIVEGTEIPCLIEDLNLWAKVDFKAGFEFAQKWFPAKGVLIPKNTILLCKVDDYYIIGFYDGFKWKDDADNSIAEVREWRRISF